MGKNLAALLGAHLFVSLGGLSIPPLIPFFQPKLELTYAQVGSIMTFLYLGAMVMSLPAGSLTDRLGVKKVIFLSQVIMGVFVVLFSFIQNYLMAILLAFLMGLGYGMVNPPTTKGIILLVKRENWGFIMGLKQTGVPIGSAVAAGVLPLLAILFSWRFSFAFAGIVVILGGFLSYFLYHQSREKTFSPPLNSEEILQDNWKAVFQNKNIILLSIGAAFCSLVQIALVTYIILYLRDVKKFDLILASFYLAMINIGGILGRIFWGVISDRLFKGSRKAVLKLIVFLIFLISLILGLNIDLPPVILFSMLLIFGVSAIGWNGVYHAFIGEISKEKLVGRAVGLSIGIVLIGNLSGPIIFGKIIDLTNSYNMAWYFLSLMMTGAFFAFNMIHEEKISVGSIRRTEWA